MLAILACKCLPLNSSSSSGESSGTSNESKSSVLRPGYQIISQNLSKQGILEKNMTWKMPTGMTYHWQHYGVHMASCLMRETLKIHAEGSLHVMQVARAISLCLVFFHATNKWEIYFTYKVFEGSYLHVAVRHEIENKIKLRWRVQTQRECKVVSLLLKFLRKD